MEPEVILFDGPTSALDLETSGVALVASIDRMTIHFIGAGPGASDLITVRGLELIKRAPVVLYAGSLVPREIVAAAPAAARVLDTAAMTLPEIAQTVILTRTATRSSAMPPHEHLETLARSRATLAIHLSITNLAKVVRTLVPIYGATCPAVVAYRVSWPDELILRGTLADIRVQAKRAGITRTALILVGPALVPHDDATPSRLYDPGHSHVLRPGKAR
jgi:precorrin-4 methylase